MFGHKNKGWGWYKGVTEVMLEMKLGWSIYNFLDYTMNNLQDTQSSRSNNQIHLRLEFQSYTNT